jgi:hypothetical protein
LFGNLPHLFGVYLSNLNRDLRLYLRVFHLPRVFPVKDPGQLALRFSLPRGMLFSINGSLMWFDDMLSLNVVTATASSMLSPDGVSRLLLASALSLSPPSAPKLTGPTS